MSRALGTFEAIAEHLAATQSGQVYRDGAGLSMNVALDFPAAITLHFRSSGVMRVTLALPIRLTSQNREAFELAALALNRTALGVSVIVASRGLLIVSQVPVGAGPLTTKVLDRTLALCIERAKTALPVLRQTAKTGLVSS